MRDNGKPVTDSLVLGQLAGSGVLFIALLFLPGFLSVRAYHNMLGLPVDLAVSYLDYLVAGVRFFVSTLMSAALFVLAGLVPVIVFAALLPSLRGSERAARFRTWIRLPVVVLTVNALAGALLAYTLIVLRAALERRNLLFAGAPRGEGYERLEVLCVVSMCAAWWVVARVNRQHAMGMILSAMILILAAAQLLLLPMAYGALEIPADVPRVLQIGAAPVDGRMLLAGRDAAGNYVVYDAGRRTITVLPGGNLQLELGPREDLLHDPR